MGFVVNRTCAILYLPSLEVTSTVPLYLALILAKFPASSFTMFHCCNKPCKNFKNVKGYFVTSLLDIPSGAERGVGVY